MNIELPFISITDHVAHHAAWRPERCALVCDGRRITWRELDARVARVARLLVARKLRPGDRAAVLMTNMVETVEIMLGIVRAGGCVVPLSALNTAESLRMMLEDSDARFLFVSAPLGDLVAPLRRELSDDLADNCFSVGFEGEGWRAYEDALRSVASDDTPHAPRARFGDDFNIIYTSGTTGAPKGIVHTHYARAQFAALLAAEFHFEPSSAALITTPLFANGTWLMLLPALFVGTRVVLARQFRPDDALRLIEDERCTHAFMVPTQLAAIVNSPDFRACDLSSMRALVSAGAPLDSHTKSFLRERFPDALFELYGLTEGVATTLRPEEMDGKLASVGKPVGGGDIRIIDDAGRELLRGEAGEIVGYTSALMRGYHKQPAATAASLWHDSFGRSYLKTGDIGRLDEDGFLYVLDRKKDMIISGGVNVFPKDIEDVLARHPAIAEAAVIGIPDAKWGEAPLALVTRRDGADADGATAESLLAWVNERLAKHQRIAGVEFRDALPRNALGKVLKKELREAYREAAT